jgi:hypothetical protein
VFVNSCTREKIKLVPTGSPRICLTGGTFAILVCRRAGIDPAVNRQSVDRRVQPILLDENERKNVNNQNNNTGDILGKIKST